MTHFSISFRMPKKHVLQSDSIPDFYEIRSAEEASGAGGLMNMLKKSKGTVIVFHHIHQLAAFYTLFG